MTIAIRQQVFKFLRNFEYFIFYEIAYHACKLELNYFYWIWTLSVHGLLHVIIIILGINIKFIHVPKMGTLGSKRLRILFTRFIP